MKRTDGPPDGERSTATDHTTDESADVDSNVTTAQLGDLPARVRERLSSRREFLSDSAKVGGGALALSSAGGIAAAQTEEYHGEDDDDSEGDGEVDQPDGFSAEAVAPHATFPDDVGAAFGVTFEEGGEESAFLHDASTMVVAEVTFEPGGTSGWHTHPGPVLVNIVEGELDITFGNDCITHTYEAGEAFIDTGGHAELATNTSESEPVTAYAVFFGVPDGESPTTWVEPQDC